MATTLFSAADAEVLTRPHVQRAWFGEVHLPSGTRYLHTGDGPFNLDGITWEGVSDPFGGQLVSVGSIEAPRFGAAPAVDIVISGASKTFLKQFWDDRATIEGSRCDLSFAVFDWESGEILIARKTLFPGKLTAPKFVFTGAGVRAIHMRVVSPGEGLNFPATKAEWSPAAQRARYPGDKGLDLINAQIVEEYKK